MWKPSSMLFIYIWFFSCIVCPIYIYSLPQCMCIYIQYINTYLYVTILESWLKFILKINTFHSSNLIVIILTTQVSNELHLLCYIYWSNFFEKCVLLRVDLNVRNVHIKSELRVYTKGGTALGTTVLFNIKAGTINCCSLDIGRN